MKKILLTLALALIACCSEKTFQIREVSEENVPLTYTGDVANVVAGAADRARPVELLKMHFATGFAGDTPAVQGDAVVVNSTVFAKLPVPGKEKMKVMQGRAYSPFAAGIKKGYKPRYLVTLNSPEGLPFHELTEKIFETAKSRTLAFFGTFEFKTLSVMSFKKTPVKRECPYQRDLRSKYIEVFNLSDKKAAVFGIVTSSLDRNVKKVSHQNPLDTGPADISFHTGAIIFRSDKKPPPGLKFFEMVQAVRQENMQDVFRFLSQSVILNARVYVFEIDKITSE